MHFQLGMRACVYLWVHDFVCQHGPKWYAVCVVPILCSTCIWYVSVQRADDFGSGKVFVQGLDHAPNMNLFENIDDNIRMRMNVCQKCTGGRLSRAQLKFGTLWQRRDTLVVTHSDVFFHILRLSRYLPPSRWHTVEDACITHIIQHSRSAHMRKICYDSHRHTLSHSVLVTHI